MPEVLVQNLDGSTTRISVGKLEETMYAPRFTEWISEIGIQTRVDSAEFGVRTFKNQHMIDFQTLLPLFREVKA